MLESITAIFVKYWVEIILGLIASGGAFLVKRYIKLEKDERQRSQDAHYLQLITEIKEENQNMITSLKQEHDEISNRSNERYNEITSKVSEAMIAAREESKADDAALQEQISNAEKELSALRAGMLSIQGRSFKAECRKLLDENHVITLDEWEEIDADHEAYNGLGGNHRGDYLFGLVKKKAENTLTDVH